MQGNSCGYAASTAALGQKTETKTDHTALFVASCDFDEANEFEPHDQ
jgi:hypothetical protein